MKLDRLGIACVLVLLAACQPRGVSIGTEELCVGDERLTLAEPSAGATTGVSSCATIGENQLENAGFEAPLVSVACGSTSLFCQLPAAEVGGWGTSSAEQVIEIWLAGHMEVPAAEGSQFGELNARSRDSLHQDVPLPPGQLMYWSLLHRGREGIDSMEVQIGPPDALEIHATISSPEDDWYPYSGLYRVGDDEPLTRFALVSRNGEEKGNLVDSLVFAPVSEP